jgi:hypothetical protein
MLQNIPQMADILLVVCPHCKQWIEIVAVNCAVFRCGTIKRTGQQISPHAPKAECERLLERGEIYGCSKPFQLERDPANPSIYRAIKCEYI